MHIEEMMKVTDDINLMSKEGSEDKPARTILHIVDRGREWLILFLKKGEEYLDRNSNINNNIV
jgi:hypothetical protein